MDTSTHTVNEVGPSSIEDAIAASAEMRLAMWELNLRDELFVVLDVRSSQATKASFLTPVPQNPLVALAHSRGETRKRYYLKLLRPSRRAEIIMLSDLAGYESPDNHVVRLLAFRDCDIGTLLLLPDAGIDLDHYKEVRAHLISIASQFLRAVAFLHANKVAHCDLKPSNVVVDPDTGRVTLIDFDLAVRGCDWLAGYSGTATWTAPEVGNVNRYDPFRADIWAAGKVLEAILKDCPDSADCDFLLRLSMAMMATDPNSRPSMEDVVMDFGRYVMGYADIPC